MNLNRRLRRRSAVASGWSYLLVTILTVFAAAAQDGAVDGTFQGPPFDGPVPLIALEASGKVLYAHAPDNFRYRLGRLTTTGAPEDSVSIGLGPESITAPIDVGTIHLPGTTNAGTINAIQPLPNGQILVGGSFSHFDRVARRLLVRLNADGSVDGTFHQGSGFEGDSIYGLALGAGGKIYAGGKFSKFNGSSRNVGLVRLNADGSLDASFVDSVISFGATVTSVSLQSDGKPLIEAAYANSSFQATRQLYRLAANGGLDSTFAQGGGTPAVAAGLQHGLMSNGQILLAGGNGTYNGATVNSSLFRLNANGTIDASYPGLLVKLVNVTGLIGRFLPAPDGRIYFSGAFDKVAGQSLLGLGRLNADGTLDPTFVPGAPVTASPGALALQPDGKILAGALISGVQPKWTIVRLHGAGHAVSPGQGPTIGPVTFQKGGVVQFPVSGPASKVVIQASANLTAWTSLLTNAVANGTVSFTDPQVATSTARFYRLLVSP